MRTFPDADPGTPDVRGPWRFVLWIAVCHWRALLVDCVCNVLWTATPPLSSYAIGRAVDGLIARDQAALIWWGLVVLGLGAGTAVFATMVERAKTCVRIGAGYQAVQLVTRQVCALGAGVGRRASAGDLVTVGASDIGQVGQFLQTGTRGVGGAAGFILVAVLMLTASWEVGVLVLVAVPAILLVTTRLSRMTVGRLREVRAQRRELTDQAVDIVRGLRVLRGFGGGGTFAGRYRQESQKLRFATLGVSRVTTTLTAATAFLPGLLLVGVVALSGELALGGQLSAGEVVAFLGYASFLTRPVTQMTSVVVGARPARVAAENIIRLLGMEPDIAPGPAPAAGPEEGARGGTLADPVSGLVVAPAGLTAVVCSAADALMLADRLGRYVDEPAVTYGGEPLAALPLPVVRERILVATAGAHLFAGPLGRELDPAGRLEEADGDGALWATIDAAAARDVIEALPRGLDTEAAAGGREFSGGQQQRLRLARALMADPEVLILIDPTSAVDAHTESRMASGIASLRAAGRATLVFTTSAVLLNQADRVALVVDGAVAAQGTHEDLMGDARYAALVERGTVPA